MKGGNMQIPIMKYRAKPEGQTYHPLLVRFATPAHPPRLQQLVDLVVDEAADPLVKLVALAHERSCVAAWLKLSLRWLLLRLPFFVSL